jgi:vacuolar-type H+-ATPase subunit I/STV1
VIGSAGGAVVATLLAGVPLALSVWALLDAAGRPEWAWALAGRRRVMWIAAILFGVLTLVVGLVVSVIYLVRVRPEIAAAEQGRVGR